MLYYIDVLLTEDILAINNLSTKSRLIKCLIDSNIYSLGKCTAKFYSLINILFHCYLCCSVAKRIENEANNTLSLC